MEFRPTILFPLEDGSSTFATGNKKHICVNLTFFVPFVDEQAFLVFQYFQQDTSRECLLAEDLACAAIQNQK